MRVIQPCLIDTGSSTRSLSVLMSAMKTSLGRTCTVFDGALAGIFIFSAHVRALRVQAAATIRGWRLFRLELPFYIKKFWLKMHQNQSHREENFPGGSCPKIPLDKLCLHTH